MILLHGTGTHNKGAELMAIAVLEHFRSRPNPPEFTVPPTFGSYPDRAKYGLWSLLSERRTGRARLIAVLAHAGFRRKYGLAAETDVAAVIDASGFAFGDQHGARPTLEMAANCRRWKKQGKKIVLLPQAFGPFSSAEIRAACRRMVDHCDLVFAREETSYRHLVEVGGERPTVRLAPDFTTVIPGRLPKHFRRSDNAAFVVPNQRMLDKTDPAAADGYVPFLAEIARMLRDFRLHAMLLIHTPEDRELTAKVQERCAFPIDVIEETCPIGLKGILSTGSVVISSRFHALIGALSQNVPALSVGWSHKYRQLMHDYGCRDAIAEVGDLHAINSWLAAVTESERRAAVVATLKERNEHLRQAVREMWHHVDVVLAE